MPGGPDMLFVSDGALWTYFKGTSEPSARWGAWRQLDFDDSAWRSGRTPIGYGESGLATTLADMRGNYTSVYLRRTFDVADLAALESLILEIRCDDGVNVWLNSRPAFSANVAGADLPYTATAAGSISPEPTDFLRQDLGDARPWLFEGRNVIAVQVLNVSLGGSSDCCFDLRLLGRPPQGDTPLAAAATPAAAGRREPGPCEIDAAWVSGEMRTFRSGITIPAPAVTPGRMYRVRCRMKDNTGRWSHWSSPVQFVAGAPVAAGVRADLRLTELMYNPAAPPGGGLDNDEFEFLELKNTGAQTLDLSSVSFEKGVTFHFAGGSALSLAPGGFVLVVKNRQTFLSRYGAALAGLIAGEYEGKLANDGETIALVDTWNGTIVEFTYGAGDGWPAAAGGGGHSLVPLEAAVPTEPQGSLNDPAHWRPSTHPGGSPGHDDPLP